MVVVSYSGKEINAKLVYYGAGLCGKTTNLESIYEAVPDTSRGKMVSMKTQSDRTLFFDLLPLDLGEIMGYKTRFLLYTVPGQVFYNATRKLVLKGADAIVFVADSQRGKMDENKESLANLRTNLSEYGLRLDDIPWVIQYNKRDLPDVYTVDELNADLNPNGKVPFFEAVAKDGKGVFETFRGISHQLMEKVTRELRRSPMPKTQTRGTTAASVAPAGPSGSAEERAPEPLGRSILREVRETAGESVGARDDHAFEYGRNLDLDSPVAPTRAPATPPAATASPSIPEPAAAKGEAEPLVTTQIATSPSDDLDLEPPTRAEATPRTTQGVDEITIPVRIPRGRRQIVLRIVVSQSE